MTVRIEHSDMLEAIPRRAAVFLLARARGFVEVMLLPEEIFLEAGYSQTEIDEMQAAAEKRCFGDSE